MATKLGEMLVEAGVLTAAQLDDALKSQVVFGGRLGTNLIEMGYLGEDDLAVFLSRKLGLPCAAPDQLMAVPNDVIRLVQKELADKYQIIPMGLEKKRLTLAMLDPSDLSLMDEISFVTGYFILPVIAPELRMVLALEKHYGIKPDMRFVQAAEKMMERQKLHAAESKKEKVSLQPVPAATPTQRGKDKIFESLEKIAHPVEPVAVEPVSVKTVAEEPVAIEPIDIEPVAVESLMAEPMAAEPIEIEPMDIEPVAAEPHRKESPKQAPARTESAKLTAEGLADGLTEAKDREEIANLLVTHLAGEFSRVALFMIKGTVAEGWRGLHNGRAIPGIEELQISLDTQSVLKVVTDGKSYYLGAIPETPENSRLLAGIGGGSPSSALLIPLTLMGRTVAIVYLDGGKVPLASRLAHLQKIVGKTAMAFEILILKNKILMT